MTTFDRQTTVECTASLIDAAETFARQCFGEPRSVELATVITTPGPKLSGTFYLEDGVQHYHITYEGRGRWRVEW